MLDHRGERVERERMRKGYIDTSFGQLHYLTAGSAGPRIVLLHESPLSNRIYAPVAELIARWGQVFAPDTPGYGQSSPIPRGSSLPDFASSLLEGIVKWSEGEKIILAGIHTGASLCVEIAHQAPSLVAGIMPIGLPTYTEEMRESRLKSYAPGVDITRDGAHVAWAWDRYVNMWPTAPLEHIELAVEDLIYNLPRYNQAYLEAFKYRVEDVIGDLKCAVELSAAQGEFLHEGTKELAAKLGHPFVSFPGEDWQGQVSLRNPQEMNQALKDFAQRIG